MLRVEPIQKFDGFGIGNSQSEYVYSQGMSRGLFGIAPAWSSTEQAKSGSLSGLGLIQWMTQGTFGGTTYKFGLDASGNVYRALVGGSTWTKIYNPASSCHGNGLIVDQTGRLLLFTDRYIVKYDGTANYTTGTVAVTNGSPAVVGTGTTFTAGMVGKGFKVGNDTATYKVATFTDATHITLATNYGGTTNATATYTLYQGWTEDWRDFGAANETIGFRPADVYEDEVVIGNANAAAVLFVTDDSFNPIMLNLPSGYNVRAIRSGKNGVLVSLNFNEKGAVLLWDAYSPRSIAPWIWFKSNVKCLLPTDNGWIVITSKGIFTTNGYSNPNLNTRDALYPVMPDDRLSSTTMLSSILPQGADLVGGKLVFLGGSDFNRQKAGIYILDITTKLFEFAPVSNGCLQGVISGALFFDSNFNCNYGYQTSIPNASYIGKLLNTAPSMAFFVTDPKGMVADNAGLPGNVLVAQAAKFSFAVNSRQTGNPTQTFNATLKIYNFRRNLWNYAQTNNASGSANLIKIDGTLFPGAKAGDEVTVLQGVNAGLIRHISSIANAGTNTETWTLDSALPSTTENNVFVSVSPFYLVYKFTFTSVSELQDVFFDIQNRLRGKKFLLKLVLDGMTNTELEIGDGVFIFDDQGLIKA